MKMINVIVAAIRLFSAWCQCMTNPSQFDSASVLRDQKEPEQPMAHTKTHDAPSQTAPISRRDGVQTNSRSSTHRIQAFARPAIAIAFGLSNWFCSQVLATTYVIPPSAPQNIQIYIDFVAVAGDVIELQAGTYLIPAPVNTKGKAITLRGALDLATGVPITTITGGNARHSLTCTTGEGLGTIIRDLIVTEGLGTTPWTAGTTTYYGGGGLVVNNSSPTLLNVHFVNNKAVDVGGAVLLAGASSPSFMNCRFQGNEALDVFGGAVLLAVECTSPVFNGCAFTGNRSDEAGGAIYSSNGSPNFINCSFDNNWARYTGGAFYGASWNSGGCGVVTPAFSYCNFQGNSANSGGAVAALYDCEVQFDNCTLSGNTAVASGGAVALFYDSNAAIHSCEISGNSAAQGGAVSMRYSYPSIQGSNVCENSLPQFYVDEAGGWVNAGGNTVSVCCNPSDIDGDGLADCIDGCPKDPLKGSPGVCGCGVPDFDSDGDGTADCLECVGDIVENGTVDAADLAILLAVWGLNSPAVDLNDDGTINAGDLTILLDSWGPCPS